MKDGPKWQLLRDDRVVADLVVYWASVSKTTFPGSASEAPEQGSAGQKWCERGDLNPHALSGTGS